MLLLIPVSAVQPLHSEQKATTLKPPTSYWDTVVEEVQYEWSKQVKETEDKTEAMRGHSTDHSKRGSTMKNATNKSNMQRKTYSNTSMGAKGSPPMCADCSGSSTPGPSNTPKGTSSQAKPA